MDRTDRIRNYLDRSVHSDARFDEGLGSLNARGSSIIPVNRIESELDIKVIRKFFLNHNKRGGYKGELVLMVPV